MMLATILALSALSRVASSSARPANTMASVERCAVAAWGLALIGGCGSADVGREVGQHGLPVSASSIVTDLVIPARARHALSIARQRLQECDERGLLAVIEFQAPYDAGIEAGADDELAGVVIDDGFEGSERAV